MDAERGTVPETSFRVEVFDNPDPEGRYHLLFRTDLGAHQGLDVITGALNSLHTLNRAAERWGLGTTMPSDTTRAQQQPPPAQSPRSMTPSEKLVVIRQMLEDHDVARWELDNLKDALAQGNQVFVWRWQELSTELEPSVSVVSVTYRNPLEVWLAASGSTLLALQSILVIVRDWSGKKRKLGAQATEAEARASLAQTEADLMRHLFDQVKEGTLQLDPLILLDRISDKELQAMQDLSSNPVTLRLPQTPDTGDLKPAQEQASGQDDSDDPRA